MQNNQATPVKRRVYELVMSLPTPGEQNLAATLLDVLMHQTKAEKAKRQRKKKTA
jgi:hypothetical protein